MLRWQFPEMKRAYANVDCSALLWLNNRESRGHSDVKDLARTNSMIMATSCCCGVNEAGALRSGGSNTTDAKGSLLAEARNTEDLILKAVNPDKALQLRNLNPCYQGQRAELYYHTERDAE